MLRARGSGRDIFSFGVLVLEIESGQRTNPVLVGDNMEALTSYVWKKWREGSISNIIDPSITSGSSTEIARCIHIGLQCVQENAASRPTMASVLLMLNSHSVTLQVPSQPAFFIHSSIKSDTSSTGCSRLSDVERSRGKSNQFSIKDASMMQYYNSRGSEVERSRGKSNRFSKNEASMTQDFNSKVSDVERLTGKSNQFSKKEASMLQDYSSGVSDVERSKGKSNQFSANETTVVEPHGSLGKRETSVHSALLFMLVVVFVSSILQKKLSFCA